MHVRWKRDESGNIVINPNSSKQILQFVAIVRRDHGVWAIPGVSHLEAVQQLCCPIIFNKNYCY